jgi:tetratricopeptide (TPR) repeat protein
MGIRDFFKRSASEPKAPGDLRERLNDAVRRGDNKRLRRLCTEHGDSIRRHFHDWQRVPDATRWSTHERESYARFLMIVARFFAENLGDDLLLVALYGTPLEVQERLQKGKELMESLRYEEAIVLLSDNLRDLVRLDTKDRGVDRTLAVTYGFLGDCFFQSGEAEKALGPTETALELCERIGDTDGVCTYLGNLYEVCRYLGKSESAAAYAERLGELYEKQGRVPEAARQRKRAKLLRQGEPLNRVVMDFRGETFELNDIPKLDLRDCEMTDFPRVAPTFSSNFSGRVVAGSGASRHAETGRVPQASVYRGAVA